MNSEGNHNSHLTPATIRSYLEGKLDSTAMHRVEMHLLDCGFCADAVEGFELSQQSRIKTEQTLLSLRKNLNKKIKEHERTRMLNWPAWSAAAAGIALAIAGYVVIKQQEIHQQQLAIQQEAEFLQTGVNDTLIIFLPEAPDPVSNEMALAANSRSNQANVSAYSSPAGDGDGQPQEIALPAAADERSTAALSRSARRRSPDPADPGQTVRTETTTAVVKAPTAAEAPLAARAPGEANTADETNTADEANTAASDRAQAAAGERRGEQAVVQLSATPRGGKQAYEKYLADSLRYPAEALENKVEGTVTVRFTVRPSGRPAAFEVVGSLGHGCDEEAIRLINEGPDWVSPVVKRGQPQPVKAEQAVVFNLAQTQ